MDKRLSIITIVYNNKDNLIKTIKSVREQTYKNIEYIIVDGGSTDGTVDVIKQNPDLIYDAMNKGLKLATGDYLWFMNSGDEIYANDTVEKMLQNNIDADAFYGDVQYADEKGNDLGTRTLKKPPETFSYKDMKYGMVVIHQSFVVKRELAPEYNITYKYCSDIDWMISCLKKCNNVINTKMILSKFLMGGYSKKNIIPSNKERFKVLRKHYGLTTALLVHIPLSFNFLKYYFTNKKKLY